MPIVNTDLEFDDLAVRQNKDFIVNNPQSERLKQPRRKSHKPQRRRTAARTMA